MVPLFQTTEELLIAWILDGRSSDRRVMRLKERMPSACMNDSTRIACTIGFLFLFAFSVYGDSPLSIELAPYIGRLKTVSVELNGKEHAFLFDTAGGVAILTPDVAKEICEPFGRITLFRMSGERLDLQQCGAQTLKMGDFETQAETAVLDLMALLPEGAPAIGGLLSLNAFHDQIVTIDLKNNLLTIETESSVQQRIRDMSPLRMRRSSSPTGNSLDVFIAVRGGSHTLWFELDSANLSDVLVSPHAARQLGVSLPDIELQLEGLPTPLKAKATERDLIYDGALNAAVMEKLVLTIHFRANKIWGKIHP
jgi:hypothetical protein